MKILLVDDNRADVFLVEDAIRQEGLQVEIHTADNGEMAIQIIRDTDENPDTRCFDCFMIDLNLPRQSGVEVVKKIRSSARCLDAPVIVVTSAVAPSVRDEILQSGATHVIVKPHRLADFRDLAKLLCRRNEAGDS